MNKPQRIGSSILKLAALLLLVLPAAVQAQYNYTTNSDNTITITGYSGPGGALTITNTINDLLVTSIGSEAFYFHGSLTNVTIPSSVTSIGDNAFSSCAGLTNVLIGNSVTNIGNYAFFFCNHLTSVTIGSSVTSIGFETFYNCLNLTSVAIPNSVTSIGTGAFQFCTNLTSATIGNSLTNMGGFVFSWDSNLTGVYFLGNVPSVTNDASVFAHGSNPTVYYLPGATGWDTVFDGRSTVLWNPQAQNLDVQTNQFGFAITGSSNLVIVVEACTNLSNPVWSSVGTNTLTGGVSTFSDPESSNYPSRFYRFRAP